MKISGKKFEEHKFLFAGADEIGLHVADLLVEFMTKETGMSVTQARQQIWFMDEQGLVVRYRAEGEFPFVTSLAKNSCII